MSTQQPDPNKLMYLGLNQTQALALWAVMFGNLSDSYLDGLVPENIHLVTSRRDRIQLVVANLLCNEWDIFPMGFQPVWDKENEEKLLALYLPTRYPNQTTLVYSFVDAKGWGGWQVGEYTDIVNRLATCGFGVK